MDRMKVFLTVRTQSENFKQYEIGVYYSAKADWSHEN